MWKKLLVIAGSAHQYHTWLKDSGINPCYVKYVCKPDHLRGFEGNAIMFVGNYQANPLYNSDVLKIAIFTHDLFEIRTHQIKAYIENQIPYEKPPLGIIPEKNWKEERFFELRAVISRYADGGFPVEIKWVREYNKLQHELKCTKNPF